MNTQWAVRSVCVPGTLSIIVACCPVFGGQLTLPFVLDVCAQLSSGVQHLHACGILHRDLKSDNALVASKDPLVVKWADFGCSVKLVSGTTTYGGTGTMLHVGLLLLFVCDDGASGVFLRLISLH